MLLGAPVVVLASGERLSLERHDAALLALLVLDGPQARQDMATLLWPAVPQSKAMTSLRQRLFRLRRTVGHALVTDEGALQLAEGVGHDLDPAARLDDAAASPYEFNLLAGHHHPPGEPLTERLQSLRERWQQARAAVLESRAEELEAAGDLHGALRLALRLRAGQPASEQAARRCMHLHYLLGDRGQAMAAYARCRDHLREHLGLAPDEQTQRLARLIESARLPGRVQNTGPSATALARPPRLVGRDKLWARLHAAVAAGLPVLVRGEPGIGKTRLVSDFARSHARALVVRPSVDMGRVPYATAVALLGAWRARWAATVATGNHATTELAHIAPADWHWGPPPTDAARPRRLARALGDLLTPWASMPGACLVVDDVQWVDAASLELLLAWLDQQDRAVPADAQARPAALAPVILAVRSRSMPQALADWLQHRDADRAVLDLTLGPLDADALAELVHSLQDAEGLAHPQAAGAAAERARDLLRQTGGHPYMVLELLRQQAWARQKVHPAGDGATPGQQDARLRALLVRRIGQLPPAPQRLLQVLSMTGSSTASGAVQDASGLQADELAAAWQALADAQLLDEDGRVFDVVAEAMAADLPAALAQRLHERLALARTQAGDSPEHVAAHWRAARCWPQAGQAHAAAARAANQRGRPLEALACWDEAADAFQHAAMPAERAWALQESLTLAQLVEAGALLLQRIDRVGALARDDAQHLAVALARARALLNASEPQAVLPLARQALALAQRLRDGCAEIVAGSWLGLALTMTGQHDEGLALLHGLRQRAEAAGDARAQLDHHGARGYALHLAGDYAGALEAFDQAHAAALALGDHGEALELASNRMVCLNSLGRRGEALVSGEQMLGLWRRMGEPDSVTANSGQVQLGNLYMGAGRFAEALVLFHSALSTFRRTGPDAWRIIAEHRLARLYLILGQTARASQALNPLGADCDAGRAAMRVMVEYRIARLRGQASRAPLADAMARLGAEMSAMDRRSLRLLMCLDAPAGEALALASEVAAEAELDGDAPARHHALLRMALAHATLGHGAQAAALARQAWGATGPSAPPALLDSDPASACWWTHQAALAGGDEDLARAALQQGQRWLDETLPRVPEEFRTGYLDQNPVHRALRLARTELV